MSSVVGKIRQIQHYYHWNSHKIIILSHEGTAHIKVRTLCYYCIASVKFYLIPPEFLLMRQTSIRFHFIFLNFRIVAISHQTIINCTDIRLSIGEHQRDNRVRSRSDRSNESHSIIFSVFNIILNRSSQDLSEITLIKHEDSSLGSAIKRTVQDGSTSDEKLILHFQKSDWRVG